MTELDDGADTASRLAQFEPDPEGTGMTVTLEATGREADACPWVTFEDADGERSWAGDEILQIIPRSLA